MMNSMMRLHLRKMQRLFTVLRWAEAVGILLFALRGAPSLARASGDFLRISLSVLLGPRFLFLLGNAIVILLFFFNKKNTNNTTNTIDDDGTTTTTSIISSFIPPPVLLLPADHEITARAEEEELEVVFEDKEVVVVISENYNVSATNNYRRSRSEKIDVDRLRRRPKGSPELRRSKTHEQLQLDDDQKELLTGGEEGDAEEFRRTIEAFIEKQLKFQRQESISISNNTNLLAILSLQQQQQQQDDDDGSVVVK